MTLHEIENALLGRNIHKISEIGIGPFLVVMLVSLASALLISYFYVKFYAGRATGSQIHRAFPLLSLSITSIFISVQFSLALSLGLLGALSIVRFRNPIKEPEEIGFLMLVIACSISCATFNFMFLAILLSVAFFALWLIHRGPGFLGLKSGVGSLVIRLPESEYKTKQAELISLVERLAPKAQVDSVSVDHQTCHLTYLFQRLTPQTFLELEREITALTPGAAINVFYTRAETLV